MTTSKETPSTEAQSVAIPQNEFPAIALKLKSVSENYEFLRKLLDSKREKPHSLMTGAEAQSFENILSQAHEDLHQIYLRLVESDDSRLQKISNGLFKSESHSGFVLHRLNHSDALEVGEYERVSFQLLINETCGALLGCISELEKISVANAVIGNGKPIETTAPESHLAKRFQGVKELQKARLSLMRINGVFQLLDCRNLKEIEEGGSLILDMEQMNGVYGLLDGIAADLDQVQVILEEYCDNEEPFHSVDESIKRCLWIISLVKKIADSRISGDMDMLDVSLGVDWVDGFFTALSYSREYLGTAQQGIEKLYSILLKSAEGGSDAVDTLH